MRARQVVPEQLSSLILETKQQSKCESLEEEKIKNLRTFQTIRLFKKIFDILSLRKIGLIVFYLSMDCFCSGTIFCFPFCKSFKSLFIPKKIVKESVFQSFHFVCLQSMGKYSLTLFQTIPNFI